MDSQRGRSAEVGDHVAMSVAAEPADHEQVIVRRDTASGLHAVIAVHSTQLGPATGGCRRWTYVDEQAAIMDASRLSEGMTLKNALAGIPFGGGKSVILADGHKTPTRPQLEVFAGWLNELNGDYITAEDVGMGVPEMHTLAEFTSHVSGLGLQGVGGDPSPKTAYGVYLGLKAAVQFKLGAVDLRGISVAVQGLGAVGWSLCRRLHEAGAKLVVTDINQERVNRAVSEFGAEAVRPDKILTVEADVFAPCALGAVIDEYTADRLNVPIVAGAANNQLTNENAGLRLLRRGVLFAPDYVINAGGVISVAHEHLLQAGYFSQADSHSIDRWVSGRINSIPSRLIEILRQAEREHRTPDSVAREHAAKLLNSG